MRVTGLDATNTGTTPEERARVDDHIVQAARRAERDWWLAQPKWLRWAFRKPHPSVMGDQEDRP